MTSPIDLINDQIKGSFINSLFTTLPGKIIRVDDYQTFQTVDVQPLITKLDEDGVELIPQVLYKVPVVLLGGGGALISVPLKIGDTVLLAFSMRDIDRWKNQTGDVTTPDTKRMHNINDAVAIPGLFTTETNLNPDPDDVVIKFQGSEIRLASNGSITINSSNDITVNSSGTTVVDGNEVKLGSSATEALVLGTAFTTLFNAHTHTSSGSGPPSSPIIPGTHTSIKVKSE